MTMGVDSCYAFQVIGDIKEWMKKNYSAYITDLGITWATPGERTQGFAVALSTGKVFDITVTERKPGKLTEDDKKSFGGKSKTA